MKHPDAYTIRDYTFRETVSCPLKLLFLQEEDYNDQRDDLFRRRTKRILRESVAKQFANIKFTSNATEAAANETLSWLSEHPVSICGAVIFTNNIRARYPILSKDGNTFTIIQIHGKALKGNPADLFARHPIGKSLNRYLFKAAYRYYVLESVYPDAEIECSFMFPQKSFKAKSDHLYQKTQGVGEIDDAEMDQLRELFVEVDVTSSVKDVIKSIPNDVSHEFFSGCSISEAIKKLTVLYKKGSESTVKSVHMGCRNCRFRKPVNQHENGCWDTYFSDKSIQNRDKHLFELIGHHVREDHLIEGKYQENVIRNRDLSDAEKVMSHTDKKIAIYHRKALQLLDARNQQLPLIFAKELLTALKELEFPIHFIDFEAATHPVPSEKGKRPYDPVLFQFSCHSLLGKGDLVHTQWLDEKTYTSPHFDIIEGLKHIPELKKGTIVQFSPFERQAFYRLFNDLKQKGDHPANSEQIIFLKDVLKIGQKNQKSRFLDISVLLKDGYYNRFMNSGLSLKEILYSVLQVEDEIRTLKEESYNIEGVTVDLFKKEDGRIVDPYYQLSDERSRIRDGITAMHAYLCLKAGVLSDTQERLVPVLLKRYCSMDSLGMFLIYRHIMNLIEMNPTGGDLVIEEGNN